MTIKKDYHWVAIFLAPALIIYATFLLIPICQSIYMSFFKWKGIANVPMVFVGLKNYQRIFSNPAFWHSLVNVLWFIAGGFIVLMPLSFILALIITKNIKGTRFYKTSFFIPVILPMTAVGLMWVYILQPNGGLLNSLLELMGLGSLIKNWLGDPDIAIISVVLVNEWVYAGFNMLIFAAGLVAIPDSLFESAKIDGANSFQRIIHITLPLMKESIKIFSIMCITGCLRHFDLVFIMTGGGPARATETPATLLYNEAFKYRNFGTGNAIGVFILVAGLLISLLLNKLLVQEEM
ncbi:MULTISPECIES: carbohydrate ABC transporter permease [unclassified Oceanispirochaeta]|uniref:carbohydrate ABC transporter permease n=1 Tax=unclassified Oceanispirochaeta TaxID=2635722 RepID=UPI000E090762|nr:MULTISPECIES: sugar ABC transporter permease [unclassified Oceanispirochaeta]MBF9017580.1 sugar ABC transporter permease [Oceanispirochaeta sp. M2]NPD74152.1 sugar ABC transporter permease [Oceanispirochaeta sp. M1]RDG30071.1 sugar ABC transporter permease [Oceanispirochaeta sp. M1]